MVKSTSLETSPELLAELLEKLCRNSSNVDLRKQVLQLLDSSGASMVIRAVPIWLAKYKPFRPEDIIASLSFIDQNKLAAFLREFILRFDEYNNPRVLNGATQVLKNLSIELLIPIIHESIIHKNWNVREAMPTCFEKISDNNLRNSFLSTSLSDENRFVKMSAIRAMAWIESLDKSFGPILKEELNGQGFYGCPAAIALGRTKDASYIPVLRQVLQAKEVDHHRDAVLGLGLIGGPSIFENLEKPVRIALGGLKVENFESVFDALQGMLKIEGGEYRALAAKILGDSGKPEVIPMLRQLIVSVERRGYGDGEKEEALAAIKKLEAAEATISSKKRGWRFWKQKAAFFDSLS